MMTHESNMDRKKISAQWHGCHEALCKTKLGQQENTVREVRLIFVVLKAEISGDHKI